MRALAAVTGLTAIGLLLGPALLGPSPAGAQARVAPTCDVGVTGVDADNHLVLRKVTEDLTITSEQRTAQALDFKPRAFGVFAAEDTAQGARLFLRATAKDGRPRTVRLDVPDDTEDPLATGSGKLLNKRFEPRLFTATYGFHAFAVRGDVLRRYVTYRKPSGKLYFDDAVVVFHGMRDFKAWAYAGRFKLDRVPTDLIYATKSTGGLVLLKIPVPRPGDAERQLVKGGGFGRYTGLSLGGCNNGLAVVGVDAKDGRAKLYVVKHFREPSGEDVLDLGLVAEDADWELKAVF